MLGTDGSPHSPCCWGKGGGRVDFASLVENIIIHCNLCIVLEQL